MVAASRWVVGIIIYHGGTVAFTLNLKPAAGAVKLCRGALGIGGLQAQRAHAAAHGQRIVNVVVARNTQLDVANCSPSSRTSNS